MASVASDLKSEREKRNIPLAQIAADTRISLHHLESLEEGRYGELPGGMYNRAFLRAYCESLDLDQKEIMRRYEAEMSPAVEKPSKSRKKIPQTSRLARHYTIMAWSVMLLVSATGLFFSRNWIASVFSPYFSRTPIAAVRNEPVSPPAVTPAAASQPAADTPAPEPAAPSPESVMPTETIAASSETQAGVATVLSATVPAPSVPASAVAASPVPAAPASASPLRVRIEITEECWMSVDSDGRPSIRRVLKAGETQSFEASRKINLIMGNAGGVRLQINGKPAKLLGKTGEVVKVEINETNLADFIDQTAG